MRRVVLHSDCNSFFANAAIVYRPDVKDKPVVVGGDEKARAGIVLAANQLAKKIYRVKTGEALYAVRQRCPGLVVVKPDHKLYHKFTGLARSIYCDYTDQVEPFGLDEAFIDVTGSTHLFGGGEKIANDIRARVKEELGITVSIGVSDCKVIAKLASDMRKPDFTTVVPREDLPRKVWPLPVGDLLYVGAATADKLQLYGIRTIGDLAKSERKDVIRWVKSKNGGMIWDYANGYDSSSVSKFEDCFTDHGMETVGHSKVAPRDLVNNDEVWVFLLMLSEAVAMRLREMNQLCRTVQIWLRDNKLHSFTRQCKPPSPTNSTLEIAKTAMNLFLASYDSFGSPGSTLHPVRAMGVSGGNWIREGQFEQLSFFPEERERQRRGHLDHVIDGIRGRFGHKVIARGALMADPRLGSCNPKDDHIRTFPGGQ